MLFFSFCFAGGVRCVCVIHGEITQSTENPNAGEIYVSADRRVTVVEERCQGGALDALLDGAVHEAREVREGAIEVDEL